MWVCVFCWIQITHLNLIWIAEVCLWVSLKKSGLFSPLTFTTEGKASNPVCCSCCHGTVGQECSGLTVFLGCQFRSPGTYHQVSYYSERRICTVTEYPESSANTLCCDSDFFPSKIHKAHLVVMFFSTWHRAGCLPSGTKTLIHHM